MLKLNKIHAMKYFITTCLLLCLTFSCNSSKKTTKSDVDESTKTVKNDTVKISNPDSGYDVIIIEPGFSVWLETKAKPKSFYNQKTLENKNIQMVSQWNTRVLQPSKYDSKLYEMQINYQSGTDYGFDMNYKLYNYFIFFQNKYKQNLLGSRVPTN